MYLYTERGLNLSRIHRKILKLGGDIEGSREDDSNDSDNKEDNSIPSGNAFLLFTIITLIVVAFYKNRKLN